MTNSSSLVGTIRNLNETKGFGFIRAADGSEFFFHRSAADDFETLTVGMAVRFDPSTGPKGARAERVVRL